MTVIKRYELFFGGRPTKSISGFVKYWNSSTPIALNNIEVTLEDTSENIVATTTTDTDGFYKFDDVSNGTYVLKITSQGSYIHGGVSDEDAMAVNGFSVSPYSIERVRYLAADSVGDYAIDGLDASLITEFVYTNNPSVLARYPFVYFKANELIAVNTSLPFSQPNVVVDNASETYDMYFLWAGDFDGSWTP